MIWMIGLALGIRPLNGALVLRAIMSHGFDGRCATQIE
jgi:hypothetical protein